LPKEFEQQIGWLSKRYSCVGTNNVIDWVEGKKSLPANPVAITFDDGYADNFKLAYPIMKSFKFSGTIFMTTGRKYLKRERGRLLNKAEARELIGSGWQIESHTHTHKMLTRMRRQDIKNELSNSKNFIKSLVGYSPTELAYPGGKYNLDVKRIASQYYKAGWSIDPGFVRNDDDEFSLKRIEVRKRTPILKFKLQLTSLIELRQKLRI
jgi:peptidoglycan/xylan/chitin deacetylase (PgdA/CDA1 family)